MACGRNEARETVREDICRATNEDFRHLGDGLPPDIARLVAAGAFDRALALIDAELEAPTRPLLAPALRAERARILRTRQFFSVTREAAIEQISAQWEGFGEAELDKLLDHGRIDWRYVDGEQRFPPNFADSLPLYPSEVPGMDCPPTDRTALREVLAEMRERGFAERRVRLRASIEAADAVTVSADSPVRAWLPVPAACPQIAGFEVLDATPGMRLAPADAPQRTAFWETTGESSFFVEYAYDIRATYVDLWPDLAPASPADKNRELVVPPADPRFSPAPAPTPDDLAEELPHIAFTPYLRALADRIFDDIPADDGLARARAAYDYVTNNVDYRFQPPYLLLDCIADSCARSLRADCGVFAILFITLCRLGGVPARWQSGLSVTPERAGCHDWAMFYVEGVGWRWADCSFGSSARREGDEVRRRFYFGNLDPWRMVANARFFGELTPPDECLRDDPFDNQRGEMNVDGRGLTSDEFVWSAQATVSPGAGSWLTTLLGKA